MRTVWRRCVAHLVARGGRYVASPQKVHLVSAMQGSKMHMMTNREELRDRIEVRRRALLERFHALKADAHHDAIRARAQVKRQLDELEQYLAGGWDRLSDATRAKLDQWLRHD
jgi:hypothetical protein